ncbi:EAL domain-containing protein [Marinicella sp. S1101]|uniref:EAL domain-containing protein n=1 Tax=Marinicella marina TaxID=2996016 RepID=UPI0022609CBA|nr:EAL domain-containing protein [Marinicella marina]MCX7554571.1 EAL domain-containing protein [Marinicella marina]MDJ1141045.1 EAL domain-containing protein [Marinicella marina]
MNLIAFQQNTQTDLRFALQEIMGADMQSQNWLEMLYRPTNLLGNTDVERYFKSLNTQQKIELDIQIFNQIPRILEQEQPSRLSVNLTPISLLSDAFKENLMRLIDNRLIAPENMCIEIIEIHSMPTLSNSSIDLLKYFRSLGGWIALDDFGSGFAHWDLLQIGLIDVIKVANQNLSYRRETPTFTEGLAKFADAMKINTVLEGVETKQDFIKGRNQGFKNFQGWYFNE